MPRVESECAGQAKAAMEYLVRTNALRFGPHNITVNAVIPGIVESEAWDKCGSEVRPPNLFPFQKPHCLDHNVLLSFPGACEIGSVTHRARPGTCGGRCSRPLHILTKTTASLTEPVPRGPSASLGDRIVCESLGIVWPGVCSPPIIPVRAVKDLICILLPGALSSPTHMQPEAARTTRTPDADISVPVLALTHKCSKRRLESVINLM